MATADSVKNKINGLITKSNEVTGRDDDNLTDAVAALADGYGVSDIEDAVVSGTFSGVYTNNRITRIHRETFSFTNITGVDCPLVTEVDRQAFYYSDLKDINLPLLKTVGYNAFHTCQSLTKADFSHLESIAAGGFQLTGLTTFILRNTETVCSLAGVTVFNQSPIASGTGYIYVPDDLVESYKTAQYWTNYADQIKPLSELEGTE